MLKKQDNMLPTLEDDKEHNNSTCIPSKHQKSFLQFILIKIMILSTLNYMSPSVSFQNNKNHYFLHIFILMKKDNGNVFSDISCHNDNHG